MGLVIRYVRLILGVDHSNSHHETVIKTVTMAIYLMYRDYDQILRIRYKSLLLKVMKSCPIFSEGSELEP